MTKILRINSKWQILYRSKISNNQSQIEQPNTIFNRTILIYALNLSKKVEAITLLYEIKMVISPKDARLACYLKQYQYTPKNNKNDLNNIHN